MTSSTSGSGLQVVSTPFLQRAILSLQSHRGMTFRRPFTITTGWPSG
eukprot:jgi/Astpho2/8381/Aster-01444